MVIHGRKGIRGFATFHGAGLGALLGALCACTGVGPCPVPQEAPCDSRAGREHNPECTEDDDTVVDDDASPDDDTTPSDDDTAPDDDTTPAPTCNGKGEYVNGHYLTGACANNLDDDGDGCVDVCDPDCEHIKVGNDLKEIETNDYRANLPCYDGDDNDGDGLIDCFDPDCTDADGLSSGFTDCRDLYGYDPDIECAAIP